MKKTIHSIGDQVEKLCPDCKIQLNHFIKNITKAGKISRVSCARCGLIGTYKEPERLKVFKDVADAQYEQSRTFKCGQYMLHPIFGQGKVITVFDTKTIDVLFIDRMRRLIHSRN